VIAAAALLAYAGLLLAVGPLLARIRWPDRAPRLAIAAWLALAYSAVASVALAGLALLVPTERLSGLLARLLTACGMALRAQYAHSGGPAVAAAGGMLAAVVVARLTWSAVTTLAATARAGRCGCLMTPSSPPC
jgi:bla regulator protein blaR1